MMRNMDDHDHFSLVEALLSGFVNKKDNVDAQYEPTLIANHDGRTMEYAIKDELQRSQDFDMSVAFVSQGALQVLKQYFLDFADNNDHQAGRIITSTFNYFNSPKAFRELLKLQRETGIQVQVWQPERSSRNDDDATAAYLIIQRLCFPSCARRRAAVFHVCRSSNLTINALNSNREWNLKVATTDTSGLAEQLSEEIESQISEIEAAHRRLAETVRGRLQKVRAATAESQADRKNKPIANHSAERHAGGSADESRTATQAGRKPCDHRFRYRTGKTYLSAFDVRQVKPNRMLYIAQQEQILKKAEESFQKVLGCPKSELGLFSGGSKESDRKYVFATVQTMSRPETLAQFDADEFDYILVDEVHHAAAESYKRVIDHFQPNFMLGMTATPERTDGANIFELFGNNVATKSACRRRLKRTCSARSTITGCTNTFRTRPTRRSPAKTSSRVNDRPGT